MSHKPSHKPTIDADTAQLHSMGYAQELARRMSGFSNFAISFSIICILAGGITAFPNGFAAAGGASIGIGWLVGSAFAFIVALAMAQIASAYPTAGGLYHWSSILGNRGWGWATAWFNLLGLIFVVASVDVGVFLLFRDLIAKPVLGMNVENWGATHQIIGVALILIVQGILNHRGIRVTTMMTDLSGYLIFIVAICLTLAVLIFAPVPIDLSRLFTFSNNTGLPADGSVWPRTENMLQAFLLGLILVCYTVTGFDASAHTSEETRSAASTVPRAMLQSVIWSCLFGYVMVCAFVLAMPSVKEGAEQGFGVFGWMMDASNMPDALRKLLNVGIVFCNFLCGLACLTSCSRMIYAFARDGGLPASKKLSEVSSVYRTPVMAIWVGAILAFAATLYSEAFSVLAAGCAVFLYISYIMPVVSGLLAEGRTWNKKGPFSLGAWSKVVAVLAMIGGVILAWVGMQPPNDKVGTLTFGLIIALLLVWFLYARKHFAGPPTDERISTRQREISEIEAKYHS